MDEQSNSGFLVYEYAAGGTLAEILSDSAEERMEYPWHHRLDTFIQIAIAIQYCHSRGVKHRDIKPENICFVDDNLLTSLLIDFGISTDSVGTATSWGGTLPYMAPEYKNHCEGSKAQFQEATEVYSLGVLLIALLTARTAAVELEDAKELLRLNKDSFFSLCDPCAGSWNNVVLDKLGELAFLSTQDNVSARPTLKQIVEDLRSLKSSTKVELTKTQTTALEIATQYSTTGSIVVDGNQFTSKMCSSCASVSCISCHRHHNFCTLCLESCVKHQTWSDAIRCNVDGCTQEFEVADLKDRVGHEYLANYAIAQHQLQNRVRKENRLESLVREIQSKMASKTQIDSAFGFALSNKSECPTLCILLPVRSSRFRFLRFSKEYRLYFLCAFDQSPTESHIQVRHKRKWVKKVAPVLTTTLWILQLLCALSSVPLTIPVVPGANNDEKLRYLMRSMADLMDSHHYQEMIGAFENFDLDSMDETSVRTLMSQLALSVDAGAQREILSLASKPSNCGWRDEMTTARRGSEWGWVKTINVGKWQQQDTGSVQLDL